MTIIIIIIIFQSIFQSKDIYIYIFAPETEFSSFADLSLFHFFENYPLLPRRGRNFHD